jgi:cation transport ATPase
MKDVDGVNSTNVDVETKTVSFDYDPDVITLAELKTKVSKLGYEVSDISAKDCSDHKECSTDKAHSEECSTEHHNKKTSSKKECGTDACCKKKAM